MCCELPDKLLMRRGELMRITGLSKWSVRQMIDSGVLEPVYFGKGKRRGGKRRGVVRAYFRTKDVRGLCGGGE